MPRSSSLGKQPANIQSLIEDIQEYGEEDELEEDEYFDEEDDNFEDDEY